ncbi:hypothetical protein BLNAU_8627 [Blattamonas nauphoetae]|uniref:Transmembrane protein n=1 Tax=Blattamonas nauphoetae TaxID=2049346 RepID=A0ABQ9XY62_9EUKA|nr:hypothetical protein BLNAU_8627 [Blattamonas nauphoetae]
MESVIFTSLAYKTAVIEHRGALSLTNCQFRSLAASSASSLSPIVIQQSLPSLRVENCFFSDNTGPAGQDISIATGTTVTASEIINTGTRSANPAPRLNDLTETLADALSDLETELWVAEEGSEVWTCGREENPCSSLPFAFSILNPIYHITIHTTGTHSLSAHQAHHSELSLVSATDTPFALQMNGSFSFTDSNFSLSSVDVTLPGGEAIPTLFLLIRTTASFSHVVISAKTDWVLVANHIIFSSDGKLTIDGLKITNFTTNANTTGFCISFASSEHDCVIRNSAFTSITSSGDGTAIGVVLSGSNFLELSQINFIDCQTDEELNASCLSLTLNNEKSSFNFTDLTFHTTPESLTQPSPASSLLAAAYPPPLILIGAHNLIDFILPSRFNFDWESLHQSAMQGYKFTSPLTRIFLSHYMITKSSAFVDLDGDDENTCFEEEQACQSLKRALGATKPNSTISILQRIKLSETVVLNTPFTLQSANGAKHGQVNVTLAMADPAFTLNSTVTLKFILFTPTDWTACNVLVSLLPNSNLTVTNSIYYPSRTCTTSFLVGTCRNLVIIDCGRNDSVSTEFAVPLINLTADTVLVNGMYGAGFRVDLDDQSQSFVSIRSSNVTVQSLLYTNILLPKVAHMFNVQSQNPEIGMRLSLAACTFDEIIHSGNSSLISLTLPARSPSLELSSIQFLSQLSRNFISIHTDSLASLISHSVIVSLTPADPTCFIGYDDVNSQIPIQFLYYIIHTDYGTMSVATETGIDVDCCGHPDYPCSTIDFALSLSQKRTAECTLVIQHCTLTRETTFNHTSLVSKNNDTTTSLIIYIVTHSPKQAILVVGDSEVNGIMFHVTRQATVFSVQEKSALQVSNCSLDSESILTSPFFFVHGTSSLVLSSFLARKITFQRQIVVVDECSRIQIDGLKFSSSTSTVNGSLLISETPTGPISISNANISGISMESTNTITGVVLHVQVGTAPLTLTKVSLSSCTAKSSSLVLAACLFVSLTSENETTLNSNHSSHFNFSSLSFSNNKCTDKEHFEVAQSVRSIAIHATSLSAALTTTDREWIKTDNKYLTVGFEKNQFNVIIPLQTFFTVNKMMVVGMSVGIPLFVIFFIIVVSFIALQIVQSKRKSHSLPSWLRWMDGNGGFVSADAAEEWRNQRQPDDMKTIGEQASLLDDPMINPDNEMHPMTMSGRYCTLQDANQPQNRKRKPSHVGYVPFKDAIQIKTLSQKREEYLASLVKKKTKPGTRTSDETDSEYDDERSNESEDKKSSSDSEEILDNNQVESVFTFDSSQKSVPDVVSKAEDEWSKLSRPPETEATSQKEVFTVPCLSLHDASSIVLCDTSRTLSKGIRGGQFKVSIHTFGVSLARTLRVLLEREEERLKQSPDLTKRGVSQYILSMHTLMIDETDQICLALPLGSTMTPSLTTLSFSPLYSEAAHASFFSFDTNPVLLRSLNSTALDRLINGRWDEMSVSDLSNMLIHSFGIVLWEMQSKEEPFADIPETDFQSLKDSIAVGIHPITFGMKNTLSLKIARKCWQTPGQITLTEIESMFEASQAHRSMLSVNITDSACSAGDGKVSLSRRSKKSKLHSKLGSTLADDTVSTMSDVFETPEGKESVLSDILTTDQSDVNESTDSDWFDSSSD